MPTHTELLDPIEKIVFFSVFEYLSNDDGIKLTFVYSSSSGKSGIAISCFAHNTSSILRIEIATSVAPIACLIIPCGSKFPTLPCFRAFHSSSLCQYFPEFVFVVLQHQVKQILGQYQHSPPTL